MFVVSCLSMAMPLLLFPFSFAWFFRFIPIFFLALVALTGLKAFTALALFPS